ncbi:MAG: hypothetical protein ED556_12760 [Winogradskyella sp.]|uniref:VanZ family protein n=1 Tax=Winogradskyella sp. TaxID=1883156 RepID=UPI000F3D17C6|nr:VanZ family protein [Winogradskyella sp.]RNC84316.1 MAG: hypothetical protein ED556_12760 [Winogradskyella sp.]
MLKNPKTYLFTAISYTIVLVYFSLGNPSGILPKTNFVFEDKIFHFIAYVALSFLWAFYVLKSKFKRGIFITFIGTLIFGIILELIQERVNPLRTYDNYDLLANCLGVVCGTIIVIYYNNLKLK